MNNSANEGGLLIIAVCNGLGNQMFQYAFYKYLLSKGFNVFLDVGSSVAQNQVKSQRLCHETYRLNYFNTQNIRSDFRLEAEKKMGKLFYRSFLPFHEAISSQNIFSKIIITLIKVFRELCLRYKIKIKKHYYCEWTQGKNFYRNMLKSDTKMYMLGLFHDYSYANALREDLLLDFAFTREMPESVQKKLALINGLNSCAIHVRWGGDYAGNKWYDLCGIEYYKEAVRHLTRLEKDLTFFVFSNDVEYVKNNFLFLENYHIIDNSECETSDYYDLYLMSKCKHNIIPNSTFSWWGAWLNQNPLKRVVCPYKWLSDDYITTDEICPPEWTRLVAC
jgi:hypothetical protein